MKSLFFGGIHPADQKEMSASAALQKINSPKQVTIFMSQHIGNPCSPLVKVGDYVKKGQKIGDGTGLCVPVHASVSGKVTAVEQRRHPSGRNFPAVVIENDYLDVSEDTMTACEDYRKLSRETLLSMIREAGIAGMGGAAFSTSMKAAVGKNVDILIANGCECEPYITSDDLLLRTYPEQVLEGMKIIGRILSPRRMVLAVEENKKAAIEVLKRELEGKGDMELLILPARYPQGGEKQLIQAVTGKEIAPGELPSSVGTAVFNVSTFAYTYRAVCKGQPVIDRIVTVSGEGIQKPGNYQVRIGTGLEELVEAAGGLRKNTRKVIAGGPMMGIAQKDLSACTTKGMNSVLCLTKEQRGEEDGETVCIRCGQCLKVCPMRLQPLYMYAYEQKQNKDALKSLNVTDCIECGSCAYVCPGRLPLVECFRNGKKLVKEKLK